MRYKDNVLEKLLRTETITNRLQLQINRNIPQSEMSETIENLKESIEEVKSMISMEPDDFDQQFS